MDYLAAEILKLASNAARDNKEKRVIPHNLQHAIRNDAMSIMRGILSSSAEEALDVQLAPSSAAFMRRDKRIMRGKVIVLTECGDTEDTTKCQVKVDEEKPISEMPFKKYIDHFK